MKWIGWDEKWATGHAGIDLGHKKLMDLINQLALRGRLSPLIPIRSQSWQLPTL